MTKKSKKQPPPPVLLGLVKERRCNYPKREGTLRWWNCLKGSPMGLGENGDKWAVEWHPGGRGKHLYVHLPTRDISRACFTGLARGDEDRWGLFELLEPQKGGDVSEFSAASSAGGGGTAVGPVARDTPLTSALALAFPVERVIALLNELVTANRPIYATIDGDQQVVGYEPDWATRRDGVKVMLSYRDGTPVKRSEEVKRHEMSAEDGMSLIKTDRKLRAKLTKYYAWLDATEEDELAGLAKATKGRVVKSGK